MPALQWQELVSQPEPNRGHWRFYTYQATAGCFQKAWALASHPI